MIKVETYKTNMNYKILCIYYYDFSSDLGLYTWS